MQKKWEELNTERYYNYINNIIDTRGQWSIPDNIYWEGHHILPKCFKGAGKERSMHDNIIWLYAREHFEAHKILAEDNPTCKELVYAFHMMTKCVNAPNNLRGYIITSDDYELSRLMFSKCKSLEMKKKCELLKLNKEGIFSQKSRLKAAKARTGIKVKFKAPDERNKKIGASNSLKKYYNDGVNNIFVEPGTQPENFMEGRLINYDDSHRLDVCKKKFSKKVKCIETGKVYMSVLEAAADTGATHIGDCCNGKIKKSGGYTWKFIID